MVPTFWALFPAMHGNTLDVPLLLVYPQWLDPWWSKHRQYRSWDIIREPRRDCRKGRHYLTIILRKPFPENKTVAL